MSTRSAKRQHPQPIYELLYHPGIPGRGEYIRLPLEASGVAYTDIVSAEKNGYAILTAILDPSSTGDEDGNPPVFAPPALRVPGAGKNGKSLLIHQTPNILQYLGPKIGMLPDDEVDALHVNQLMLTALDMSNEVHDTHHPVAAMKYYEDQQDAAMEKAIDFRANRLPKFLSYFERTLRGNEKEGKGKYLVGGKLNYADTTLWQVLDGTMFAFPNEMKAREEEFPVIFGTFYPGVKGEEGIKQYLQSDRRQKYSMGIFRHYPELDRQCGFRIQSGTSAGLSF